MRNTAHSNDNADDTRDPYRERCAITRPVLRTASTSYIKATKVPAQHIAKLATGSLQATFNHFKQLSTNYSSTSELCNDGSRSCISFLYHQYSTPICTATTGIYYFPPHSPGSVIYSDEWRAYSRLPTLPGQMYTHHTVNHSVNFVDPVTGAHTQMVERMWGGCKGMMRQQKTMHSRLFDTYLQEFMWRKQFDGFGQNAFCNIIQHISQQYPF